ENLSAKYYGYLFLEEETPALKTDRNGIEYKEYQVKVQGIDENGEKLTVSPLEEVIVTTRDGLCFTSKDFATQEAICAINPGQEDGVKNIQNFFFRTSGVFHEQLIKVLRSNSVIKNLLSYFENKIVRMTFRVADLGVNVGAHMNPVSRESYHMVFNERYINTNGWNLILKGDNVGYDWSKIQTKEQALVIILAHESQHANHQARYEDALRFAENAGFTDGYVADPAAKWLLGQGYSEEFVSIFFIWNNTYTRWEFNNDGKQGERMHEYMRKYNQGVFDAAVDEFKNDFQDK
ncbi:hypothetical protein LJC68_10140, partial [Bacteroidales bacterium OttesenSCG-928-B11]|nr:hypothetical protein [Bacteroidales bacterium OttesenSCG-928-E04]MDL2313220.1 hypothetical protein [Bacteroidales bacterium OttesenSCG-928-B11]